LKLSKAEAIQLDGFFTKQTNKQYLKMTRHFKEHTLQINIIAWFRNEYQRKGLGIIIPVPNEYTYKDKSAVIEKGASDCIVVIKDKVFFVENKTDKGTQSEAQKDFQKRVEALGYEYWLIRNLKDFQDAVQRNIS
jgi:hypothetical protein